MLNRPGRKRDVHVVMQTPTKISGTYLSQVRPFLSLNDFLDTLAVMRNASVANET